ncbi:MAG: ABC transporter substrate-binding protein, partial [Acidimicrobiales bacterium]|nr:ABC transporter substrate-binding protein [Acidimicrobiales bacterium]
DGRDVTVTDVSRILPLRGSIAEVVFSLGLGDRVVGRDMTATFPQAAHLPLVSRSHDITAEAALALHPTVILAQSDSGPPEALDQLRNAGIPVVLVDPPGSIDDIAPRIRLIAGALGVTAAGEQLIARTNADIKQAQEKIPTGITPPRVAFLYLRGQAGVYLLGGPRSGADSMIAAAGGEDAGTAIGLSRSFTPITSEALVDAAPAILLLTTTGLDSVGGIDGLLAIPGIAQTPAGQNRRVVTVEDGLLYSFGARTPEALSILIDKFYGAP